MAPARPPSLYHPTLGVIDFQADGIAYAYLLTSEAYRAALALWSTGIGKTHLAMGLGALLFEDGLTDLMLVVAEQTKVLDWAEDDIPTHTDLSVATYYGTPAKRRRIRERATPQVLVSSYETVKNDLVKFSGAKRPEAGPLASWLAERRVLLVLDECSKLRGRTSQNHRAFDFLVNDVMRARQPDSFRVVGLTATSIEKNPEDHYNIGRLMLGYWRDAAGTRRPHVGTVDDFTRDHVRGYDLYDKPNRFANVSERDREPGYEGKTLIEKVRPVVHIKKKSDPDVRDQFPKQVEEWEVVPLGERQRRFYDVVDEAVRLLIEETEDPRERVAYERGVFTLLRQIAGHPASLLRSEGRLAQEIVGQVGAKELYEVGSAKTDRLVEYARGRTKDEGEKIVIFTFFGQSILPLLNEALLAKRMVVATNHGGLTARQRKDAQDAFKHDRDVEVFLTSDAGARGLNLGVGSYLSHFELPLLYSTFRQRSDRIHRIDSPHESVTVQSFVADGTIEVGLASPFLRRNEWDDDVMEVEPESEDEDPGERFLTAERRRALFDAARSRLKG